ncbi:hypothetical protein JHW43_008648 [Diplocarpon mali]|nr:hypothetical protein JHW43_008648 [Diplocarpon mali]
MNYHAGSDTLLLHAHAEGRGSWQLAAKRSIPVSAAGDFFSAAYSVWPRCSRPASPSGSGSETAQTVVLLSHSLQRRSLERKPDAERQEGGRCVEGGNAPGAQDVLIEKPDDGFPPKHWAEVMQRRPGNRGSVSPSPSRVLSSRARIDL